METGTLTFANQFTIRSQWEPREETPEALGEKTLHCVDAISPLYPAFRDWKFIDLFREPLEATEENIGEFTCPLEEARPRVADVVDKFGVDKDDFTGMPDPRGGYNISVFNDVSDPSQRVFLSAHGGGLVSWTTLPRRATFETETFHEADPTIVSYPVFKSILLTVVSCWDVDYASVFSRDLVQLWTDSCPFCDLSWMVYLSAPLAQRITVPSDVVVERTPDGGLLMIAAEETFDTANLLHVARARSILESLEPLNAEEAERMAKRNNWRTKGGA